MGRHRKNSPRKSAGVVRAKCGQQGKLSSFAEAAQELRDGRVIEETKYQYKCKIEAMKRWLDENYEEKSRVFDASGNLLTPMDIDVALNFFGYLTNALLNPRTCENEYATFLRRDFTDFFKPFTLILCEAASSR